MRNKIWIVFLVIGIAFAAAAGVLLNGYFHDSRNSEQVMNELRERRISVNEDSGNEKNEEDIPDPEMAEVLPEIISDDAEILIRSDSKIVENKIPETEPQREEEASDTEELSDAEGTCAQNMIDKNAGPEESGVTAVFTQESEAVSAAIDPTSTPWAKKDAYVLKREDILPEYRELYEINPELIGWIVIDNTKIDYPVVRTDNPDYYLNHDFYGNANINGVPVVTPDYDVLTPGQNILIHGHNMRTGSMFNGLLKYASEDYAKAHPIIQFDTLTERRTYAVIGALRTQIYEDDEIGFRYNVVMNGDPVVTDYFVSNLRIFSLYSTEYEYDEYDEYLELSTCAYHTKDGRFVVIAKRIDNEADTQ